ncbi:HupE/UreJ family protein [Parahaliea aestuarii]|uniref:HupE/UreJ family protein n=1 Tax=Parahaliea aestuarii TaxID=1852021 RepID=A0A5C8ZSY8_9GAMM|nr:HupE/UreJ family protein [Parahaliea aestuarii]TXS90904.1 hypothetical protein FVW59_11835 [Parahaliea aestuarii]
MNTRLIAARWCLPALLALLPQLALAHSPIEGIGRFYGGLLHPVLVLPHALALLTFALLVGQCGVSAMRRAYPPFLLALAVGLTLAGFDMTFGLPSERLLLSSALLCGLLVVLQWKLPLLAFTVLGAILGAVVGLDSGVEAGLSRQETFAALLGCWLGATIGLIVIAGVVELARRPWQKVAIRIVASWVCASTLLVLALALR